VAFQNGTGRKGQSDAKPLVAQQAHNRSSHSCDIVALDQQRILIVGYYLGHAAENLGYLQSAQKYYRIAEKLSVTQMSCHQSEINLENMGIPQNVCGGYVFPDALYPRLEVVESQLAALSAPPEPIPTHHVKRRVVRKPSSPTAASAPGSSQAAGSGFVVPTPTAAPPGGSGFVEPAPAASSSSDQFAIPPVRH
jgi:hypothetical protein